MWFCSSGFGPGPSAGTGDTTPNGSAGPTSRIAKKKETKSSVAAAYGTRFPGRRLLIHTTAAAYIERTHAQKRIDPSSAPHSEITVKKSGVARLPTCATYDTEKSCVTSATTIAPVAIVTSAKLVYTAEYTALIHSRVRRRPAITPAPMPSTTTTTETSSDPWPMSPFMRRRIPLSVFTNRQRPSVARVGQLPTFLSGYCEATAGPSAAAP